jgi:hypothetical protein
MCAAMLASGCDLFATTLPPVAGLPSDRYERGLICTAAISIFATPTAERPLSGPQLQERLKLLDTITARLQAAAWLKLQNVEQVSAAHVRVSNVMRQQGGHFGTVNLCKKAYELGPAEPAPSLPEDADMRAAACGAAAVMSKFEWFKKRERYGENPTSLYFLLQSALNTHEGDLNNRLQEAMALTDSAGGRLIQEGDAPEAHQQCLAAYPKSAPGYKMPLPTRAAERDALCTAAASLILALDPTVEKRADVKAVKALAARYGYSPAHADPTKVLRLVSDAGPPHAVLDACLAP